jgi:ATP-dependent RNA helicase DDX23/PRP28
VEKEEKEKIEKEKESQENNNQNNLEKKVIKPTAPISLEELLKQAAIDKEPKKPVFLSKAERQKLALERREAEVREQKEKLEQERKKRQQWLEEAKEALKKETRARLDDKKDRGRDRDRDRRDRDREKNRGTKKEDEKQQQEQELQKEIEAIKQHYLGGKKEKKKILKPSEKFRFVFNWDASEDTSQDINSLYANRMDLRPQFGKGYIGGIDHREQMENAKEKEREHKKLKDSRNKLIDELPGKHWSDKTLEEMTERDWRIFREDFNITTKGGGIPNPIRNWRESGLPRALLEGKEKRFHYKIYHI